MHDKIPHVAHLSPGDFRMLTGNVLRNVRRCLANDDEVPDYGIQSLSICKESPFIHPRDVNLYRGNRV